MKSIEKRITEKNPEVEGEKSVHNREKVSWVEERKSQLFKKMKLYKVGFKGLKRRTRVVLTLVAALIVGIAGLFGYQLVASASTPAYVKQWGSSGSGNGQFSVPTDAVTDSSGSVYVADFNNNRIQKFDSNGNFIKTWGSPGLGNGQFANPYHLAVDNSSGNVYVTDYYNNRIQKFDSSGNFIKTWGSSGSGNGQFSSPTDVAVGSSGNVYVTDTYNNRIQKFDSNGNFIKTWGSRGSGNGQFSETLGIATDSSGNVYVADFNTNRIQKFDSNGNFITAWNGSFNNPNDVETDSTGNVYVADIYNNRIQKFDSSGNFITAWGSRGSGNGQFNNPWGVGIDPTGRDFYVADTYNNRVQKFTASNLSPSIDSIRNSGPVNEGDRALITVTATDPDNDTLSYEFDCGNDGTYDNSPQSANSYQCPAYTDDGTYTVKARVTDGNGGEDTDTTSVVVNNVVPAVAAPSVEQTASEGESKNFDLGSFADPGEDNPWTVSIDWGDGSTEPSFDVDSPGTLGQKAHTYANEGTYTVEVTVAEEGLLSPPSGSSEFTLAVSNAPPTADAQSVETEEDEATTVTLAGSDPGSADTLGYKITTLPQSGKLYDGEGTSGSEITSAGTALSGVKVTYLPSPNYSGADSFAFVANDGTDDSDPATVGVDVNPVNDKPTISGIADQSTDEDAATGDISFTIGDEETAVGSLRISGSSDNTTLVPNASIELGGTGENRTLKATPAADESGTANITVTVTDADSDAATDTFALTVKAVNDKPVASNDEAATEEDTAIAAIDVLANDSDAEDDALSVSSFDAQSSEGGTVVKNSDGTLKYTPKADFNGTDSFSYTVNDGNSGTDTATVSITVDAVNDAPTAADDSYSVSEDQTLTDNVLGNDSDVDDEKNNLAVRVVDEPTHGTLTLNNDGSFTYEPDANYSGSDYFTYEVCDDSNKCSEQTARVDVTVQPVNDAPVANGQSATTDEDTAKPITLSATDADTNDSLTYKLTSLPTKGKLYEGTATSGSAIGAGTTIGSDKVTYVPDADYNGPDSFEFKANDGTADSDEAAKVSITVKAVNDAPEAQDDSEQTNQDTAANVNVLSNDKDRDGDALTVSAVSDPAHGTTSVNADNTVRYQPDAGYHGSDSFSYTASDGNGGTHTATVDMTVIDNVAPTARIDSGPSGTTNSKTAEFKFSSSEQGSSFECSANGATYEGCSSPKKYENLSDGSYTFYVRATDGAGNTGTEVSQAWTVDTKADAPTGLDLAASSDSGKSNTDNITNDNTPTFNGKAEANGKVELYDGTARLGEATANGSGDWSFTVPSDKALSDANHPITAKATDALGNVSDASGALSVKVDTARPTVTQVSPTNGQKKAPRSTNVTAKFSEAMNEDLITTGSSTSTFKLEKMSKGVGTLISAVTLKKATTNGITTATLDPNTDLKPGVYRATITTGGAQDIAGNSLGQDYAWGFSVP